MTPDPPSGSRLRRSHKIIFMRTPRKMLAPPLVCTCMWCNDNSLFLFKGAKYKDECPVEPFIPIYLIVGGSFGMLKTVIVLCQRARGHEDDLDMDEDGSMSSKFIDGVLNLFLFTWFIAGNIWIYSKYKPNELPPPHEPLNYCHPTLYMFAFWVITASYILMGFICFCICCLGICASCTAFFVTSKE